MNDDIEQCSEEERRPLLEGGAGKKRRSSLDPKVFIRTMSHAEHMTDDAEILISVPESLGGGYIDLRALPHEVLEEQTLPAKNHSMNIDTASLLFQSRENRWTLFKNAFKLRLFLQTSALMCCYACYGLCTGALGPSLPVLASTAGISIQSSGAFISAKGIGGLVGSIVSGKLFDRAAKLSNIATPLLVAANVLLLAVTTALLPLLKNYWLILTCLFGLGFAVGNIILGCNILLLWTWKDKSTALVTLLSFCTCFGSFLSPTIQSRLVFSTSLWLFALLTLASCFVLLAVEFLLPWLLKRVAHLQHIDFVHEMKSGAQNARAQEPHVTEEPTAAAKASAAQTAPATAHKLLATAEIAALMQAPARPTREELINLALRKLLQNSKPLGIALVTGVALFSAIGCMYSLGPLMVTWLSSPEKHLMLPAEASSLNGMYWLSIALGRLVASFAAPVLRPWVVLTCSFVGEVLLLLLLSLVSHHLNSTIMWLSIIVLGVFLAPQFPTLVAFPATSIKHVQLSAQMTSVALMFCNIGETIVPIIITHSFRVFGMGSLFPVLLVLALLGTAAVVILFLMALVYNSSSSSRQMQPPLPLSPISAAMVQAESVEEQQRQSQMTDGSLVSFIATTTPIDVRKEEARDHSTRQEARA